MYLLNTVTDLPNRTIGISDELKGVIITAIVTGTISIIGFILTNYSMRRNFQNELQRQRDTVALNQMAVMPNEVLTLMDDMINMGKTPGKGRQNETLKRSKEIMNIIYAYGSEKSIKIISLLYKEMYEASNDNNTLNHFRMVAEYILLATQIKYDVTGVSVSPELWFQMHLNDYAATKTEFKDENNKLIDELNLSDKFRIQ